MKRSEKEKERIEKIKYRLAIASLIIQILNLSNRSFNGKGLKALYLIIYGGEVYDKRIEKEVNILYKYIIFNFVYR